MKAASVREGDFSVRQRLSLQAAERHLTICGNQLRKRKQTFYDLPGKVARRKSKRLRTDGFGVGRGRLLIGRRCTVFTRVNDGDDTRSTCEAQRGRG